MKSTKLWIFILVITASLSNKASSQTNTLTTGGDASSSSGTVSYSIGQIDYVAPTGTSGSVNQGLQQPYEIFIITETHDHKIKLEMKAYPNPTDYFISLEVEGKNYTGLNYQLFDIHSKLIESKNINSRITPIDMKLITNGIYILRVISNNREIKSFKIIKNQ